MSERKMSEQLDKKQIVTKDKTPKGKSISRDPNKAIQEMMDLIDALRHIYAMENEALLAADTARFFSLQETKVEAARRYHEGAVQLMKAREEFGEGFKNKVDPELRLRLLKMQEDFSALTQTNLTALDRLRRSVQRLSDRVMMAARDVVIKGRVKYGLRGALESNTRRVSLSLNESA